MKCYRFYKAPDDMSEDVPSSVGMQDKYPIYALTNSKKLAKRFQKERNMKKFVLIKSDVEPDEYSIFANRNRSCVLSERQLLTVFDRYKKNHKIDYATVYMTEMEYQLSSEDEYINISDEFWWLNHAPSPKLFNEKIEQALKHLQYDLSYKIYTGNSCGSDDYEAPNYTFDNLALFVYKFKDLLK